MLSLTLTLAMLTQDGQQYKNPPSKSEELRKFHKPDVKAMPMSVRLGAYEQRTKMLKESIFQQITWRSVGSEFQSGRVVDIDVPRQHKNNIYVAFATGGLWRTVNEGQTWTPLFDNQSSIGIGDIDVWDDGKLIWLGSGEANSQRTSYAGTGIFKSEDGGETWSNMGLHESHHIGRVIIDPKDKNTVYVASLGPLYSQGGERGVYKTTDGGKTWNNILKVDERTGAMDIAVHPTNTQVIYATMYERDRRAWNYLESGKGSAMYKSTNGGRTWTKLTGLPSGEAMGRTAIALAPSRPDTVYAFVDNHGPDMDFGTYDDYALPGSWTIHRFKRLTQQSVKEADAESLGTFLRRYVGQGQDSNKIAADLVAGSMSLSAVWDLIEKNSANSITRPYNDGEIWRSNDAGKTWSKTRADMGSHGGYYWNEVTVHPNNHEELYTLGLLVLKSTDAGASWDAIARRNHVDHHAFWIDPDNPNKMLNGNDGGIYVSYDAGESWNHWNNLSVGQFTTIAVDNKRPYNIYGGLQDNGTLKGPSNYRPGFSSLDAWSAIGGGDGSAIAVDPRNDGDLVYIASQFGAHSVLDQESGARRSVRPRAARGEELRFNWISPVLISPHHPDIVYIGSQKLHRSFDQGRSYQALSDDLTKNIPNGDVPHSTLTTIAESYFRFGRIWVGCDDGSVKYTPDSGLTWQDISTPAKDRWVTRIIASKHSDGRIYCSQNGYRQDEWTPYVWMSDDSGKTWTSISANLPFEPVNTVREDPTNEDILYVGTDRGVYVSLNRGKSWMTYGSGIPHTPVHDIAIQERDQEIVIASHARSVWAVSIAPIHDLSQEIMESDYHQFELDVPSGRDSWAYQRSQPYQDAPARDRSIDWNFWSLNSGKAKLSLIDESGKVVVSKDIEVVHGYNFTSLSLLLSEGDAKAKPDFGDSNKIDDVLGDAYAKSRPKYVEKGKYKITVTFNANKYEEDVEIR